MSVSAVKAKPCKVCVEIKELTEFPKASVTSDGYAGECKTCKTLRIKKLKTKRAIELCDKFNNECTDCGVTHSNPSFFDFHHLDKTTKEAEVKSIIGGSYDRLLKEVTKCVMLCPNCHRERHLKEGW